MSFINKRICPCCERTSVVDFITYHNLPEILFPVDRDLRHTINMCDLPLNYCTVCHHIFQTDVDRNLNERIYRELYRYYPFENIESFQDTYRKPFNAMFDFMFSGNTSDMKLLEIGCGSVDSMRLLSERGFECTGVDPSSETVVSGGISVIGEPYEEINFENQFDVVIARFVLEHIIDLNLFMNKLRNDIKDGSLVFVQVPSIINFIKGGILCIGAHEHIHYFSRQSLSILFKRFGFAQQIVSEWRMPSLLGCFCKKKSEDSESFASPKGNIYNLFKDTVHSATESFAEIISHYKNICFYGAGLQLMWLLYIYGIDLSLNSITIVDDNEILYGRYLPGVDCPIVPLDKKVLEQNDVVVLSLSSIYYQKAVSKIRTLSAEDKKIIAYESGRWKPIY